ncbi:hypothetical protein H8E52_10840 [bacterium]|nr:hypothetical protein [bacterium]
MRGAILLLLAAIVAPAEDLQSLGDELPPDLWRPLGHSSLGLGLQGDGTLKARGEWVNSTLELLADWQEDTKLGASAAFTRGSYRLVLGALGREDGLLGQDRRRSRLGAMMSVRPPRSALSLSDVGRGTFLSWRGSSTRLRMGWQEDFGLMADLHRGDWLLRLRGEESASIRFRRERDGEVLELESAATGLAASRWGLQLRATGRLGSLRWSAQGLSLSGPRPELWRSRGWIGAESGQEAAFAMAWHLGDWRLQGGLRLRRGIGLAEDRHRREAMLSADLRRPKGRWHLEMRGLRDRDWSVAGTPAVFPIWIAEDSGSWEGRLAWRGELSWEAVLRGVQDETPSALLRFSVRERKLGSGINLGSHLYLFRSSEGRSFRLISGDFLARRSRSLRGRGAALSLSLRWNRGPILLKLDGDAGSNLEPGLAITLRWQAK